MELIEPADGLVAHAARRIGQAILRGDHLPGSNLPVEASLCQTLRVGRNALREAVRTLAAKGLVATNRRAGTRVLPLERWHLLDPDVLAWALAGDTHRAMVLAELTALRAMIMPELAALAARNATTTQTLRLAQACDVLESDPSAEAEIAFYHHLVAAAGNRFAASLLPAIALVIRAHPSPHAPRHCRESLSTILGHDGEAARRAMAALATVGNVLASTSVPRVRVRAGRREGLPV